MLNVGMLFYLIVFLIIVYGLFTVGLPFLLALLIVIIMEPLVLGIVKKLKIKRLFSSLLVSTFFSVSFFTLLTLLIIKASKEAIELSNFLISMVRDYSPEIKTITGKTEIFFYSLSPDEQELLNRVITWSIQSLQEMLSSVAGFIIDFAKFLPSFLIQVLIFFIALFLFSINLPRIKEDLLSIFDNSSHSKVEMLLGDLYKAVIGFIRAQIIMSIFIFIITFIGFTILDIDYSVATSLLITVVDILPVLGTGSVIIPMALYNFLLGQSGVGIGLLTLYAVLVIFRRVVEPQVLADSVGIGALSALISMYIGVMLFGFIGLFLGPALVIIYQGLVKVGILKVNIKV